MLKDCFGTLERLQGRYEAARALYEESLALHRELQTRAGIVDALCNLGITHVARGDHAQGRACLCECLQLSRETGQRASQARALEALAELADAQGLYEQSAWYYGASDALQE